MDEPSDGSQSGQGGAGELGEFEELREEVEALKAIFGEDLAAFSGLGEAGSWIVRLSMEAGALMEARVPASYPSDACLVSLRLPSSLVQDPDGDGGEAARLGREMEASLAAVSRAKAATGDSCLYDLVLCFRELLKALDAATAASSPPTSPPVHRRRRGGGREGCCGEWGGGGGGCQRLLRPSAG